MADLAPLIAQARAWAADDPDPQTRAQLEGVLAAAEAGDDTASADLADRFAGMLAFGTAGLRGALGAGPNRMNRSVVICAAAGLTAYLSNDAEPPRPQPFVVIGYDARRNSDVFARDTAAVVTAAGGRAVILPRPLPTPVLAYAVRTLGADAGVMVTASHNPADDNGYKVYAGDGAQIVPPTDALIAARIAQVATVADVPRADAGWEVLGEEILERYLAGIATVVRPGSPRDLVVVHTAMHGVGTETVRRAFLTAGFDEPIPVAAQADPDPAFPTVAFPNPEEPGAMDLALELAEQTGPDLVIASDPDADRCAAAVAGPGGWRMLRGDEVGALLGAHILERGLPPGATVANSIVSSRLLAAMCAAAHVDHAETLTGFKWIARTPGLAYGYEEALGYCVAPGQVLDKDGVSAAVLLAELAAERKAIGLTLLELLDELAIKHGVHATDSFSVRVADLSLIGGIMSRLRDEPPTVLAGRPVVSGVDLAEGVGGLPPTDGLRYLLDDDSRAIVRPSGTEPKLKVYLEVIEPVGGPAYLAGARQRAAERLAALRADLTGLTEAPSVS